MAEKYMPSVLKTEGKFPRASGGVTPGMTTLLDEETKQPGVVQPSRAVLHSWSPPQHLPQQQLIPSSAYTARTGFGSVFFNEPFEH